MNTTKPPECWATDANARALRVETAPGRALLLPFDQFIFAECHTEKAEQQLREAFVAHEMMKLNALVCTPKLGPIVRITGLGRYQGAVGRPENVIRILDLFRISRFGFRICGGAFH